MTLIYCSTILLSSALLFMLQPFMGRLLLPILGGSPAVWNTCMVFFQASLLAGYAYAHFLTSTFSKRTQVLMHGVVVLLPLLVLPLALPATWEPPTEASPVGWLLGVLLVSAGLPFFVVTTTSPLLQRWFATVSEGRDPYFLYATSNWGSMLALLGYPFLLEPTLTLRQQSWMWTGGYAILIGLIGLCGWTVSRSQGVLPAERAKEDAEQLTWWRRLRWIVLAAIPSSLLLGLTTHVTTDVAAIPLFWVLPLALYLFTFIWAFSCRSFAFLGKLGRLIPICIILVVLSLGRTLLDGMEWWLLGLNVVTVFLISLYCHSMLAADRPGPRRLTEFYLLLSVGGVLGGSFNALMAPLAFDSVWEYPLALSAACLMLPRPKSPARGQWNDVLFPALLAAGIVLATWLSGAFTATGSHQDPRLLILLGLPAVICYGFSERPARLALGVLALLVVGTAHEWFHEPVLHGERSFFGVHRVKHDREQEVHQLIHGTTVHGAQSTKAQLRGVSMAYYHRSGPLGQLMRQSQVFAPRARIGVLGLGCGVVAALRNPGQHITFFEIDPVVRRIAEDPRLFTYLHDTGREHYQIVLGDGRLMLARSPERFDLLVLDAFTSDSMPVHLLTREAYQVYFSRLTERGVLIVNISSRFFQLAPLIGGLADDAGWACWVQVDKTLTDLEKREGKAPSVYAVLTRDPESLRGHLDESRWRRVNGKPENFVWTDDFVNLWRVLGR